MRRAAQDRASLDDAVMESASPGARGGTHDALACGGSLGQRANNRETELDKMLEHSFLGRHIGGISPIVVDDSHRGLPQKRGDE